MHDNLPAYAKGVLGEAAVCDRLTDGGMELLERRFRSPFGEIDLVMLDGDVLAFVEVKLRRSTAFGTAGEFVDARKQQRLRTTAQLYLQQNPTGLQPRFDVIEVLAPQGMETKAPKIRHLADAF